MGFLGVDRAARRVLGAAFQERQIFLRENGQVRYLTLSRSRQAGFFMLFTALVCWSLHATYVYFSYDARLAASHRKLAEVQAAYDRIAAELDVANEKVQLAYRDMLDRGPVKQREPMITGDMRIESQLALIALEAHNADLTGNLAELASRLEASQVERDRSIAATAEMARQRGAIDAELAEIRHKNGELDDAVASLNLRLKAATAAEERSKSESDAALRQVADLQQQIATLSSDQQILMARLSQRAEGRSGKVERIIAMIGLDVNRLLAETRRDASERGVGKGGVGGPFIAYNVGKPPSSDSASVRSGDFDRMVSALDIQEQRREGLRRVLERLPLTSPVDNYHITSEFGPRIDPLNGRTAMHEGVDLGADTGAAVFSTAPGKVEFAGWQGLFGKMVEIDHGMGIKTRYAHLKSVNVHVGQRVAARTQIGVIGSTGRSTGTHLHYEVIVDGRHQNPVKFIEAGEYVYSKD
ncbi:MAG TPA: peptidoglycan DD-metalloendopeptidase family protein [Alphaproteobacteria bacterium]|nr:peptidoglycan DD-metalloendopeptidase family protein [Alphaproteobacteria bacterium]